MDDPIAIMLKFGFLAVLYLFLLWVARSALKDVAGGQATALLDDTGPTARPRGIGADLPSDTAAEQELKTPDDIDAATEAALEGTDPPSDTQGSAEYRRHLAKVLVQRALREAISR